MAQQRDEVVLTLTLPEWDKLDFPKTWEENRRSHIDEIRSSLKKNDYAVVNKDLRLCFNSQNNFYILYQNKDELLAPSREISVYKRDVKIPTIDIPAYSGSETNKEKFFPIEIIYPEEPEEVEDKLNDCEDYRRQAGFILDVFRSDKGGYEFITKEGVHYKFQSSSSSEKPYQKGFVNEEGKFIKQEEMTEDEVIQWTRAFFCDEVIADSIIHNGYQGELNGRHYFLFISKINAALQDIREMALGNNKPSQGLQSCKFQQLEDNKIKLCLYIALSLYDEKIYPDTAFLPKQEPLYLYGDIIFSNENGKIKAETTPIRLHIPNTKERLAETINILQQSNIEYRPDPIVQYILEEYKAIKNNENEEFTSLNQIYNYLIEKSKEAELSVPLNGLLNFVTAYQNYLYPNLLNPSENPQESYYQAASEYRKMKKSHVYLTTGEEILKTLVPLVPPNSIEIVGFQVAYKNRKNAGEVLDHKIEKLSRQKQTDKFTKMYTQVAIANIKYEKIQIGTQDYIRALRAANNLDKPSFIEEFFGKLGARFQTSRYRRYHQSNKDIDEKIVKPWQASKFIKMEELQSQPSDLNQDLKLANAQHKAGLISQSNTSYEKILEKIPSDINNLYEGLSDINDKLFEKFKESIAYQKAKQNLQVLIAVKNNITDLIEKKAPITLYTLIIKLDKIIGSFLSSSENERFSLSSAIPFDKSRAIKSAVNAFSNFIKMLSPGNDKLVGDFSKMKTCTEEYQANVGWLFENEKLIITSDQLHNIINLISEKEETLMMETFSSWKNEQMEQPENNNFKNLVEQYNSITSQIENEHLQIREKLKGSDEPNNNITARKYNHLNGLENYGERKRQEVEQLQTKRHFWQSKSHDKHPQDKDSDKSKHRHSF